MGFGILLTLWPISFRFDFEDTASGEWRLRLGPLTLLGHR